MVKKHIDLHVKLFHHTLLCISDDVAGPSRPGWHFPETDYAISKGVTLRDDSILVQPPPNSWYHAEMAQAFWPHWPVILEHEHYGGSKARGAWSGDLLVKSVEDYHASYMSIHWWPRVELSENRETIDRINRRLGYRLQLKSMTWPATIAAGRPFTVETSWANAGVAPCYGGGFWTLTLKDEKQGIAAVLVDEGFNVREAESRAAGPGPRRKTPFAIHGGHAASGAARLARPAAEARPLHGLCLRRQSRWHAADRPAPGWRRRPTSLPAGDGSNHAAAGGRVAAVVVFYVSSPGGPDSLHSGWHGHTRFCPALLPLARPG